MKYHIELRFKPGCASQAIDAFELHGPNHHPGVTFRQGWIDTHSRIAFVIVESSNESLVEKAAQSWAEFGECEIHSVIDIEQY